MGVVNGRTVIDSEAEEVDEIVDSELYQELESVTVKCKIRWERMDSNEET